MSSSQKQKIRSSRTTQKTREEAVLRYLRGWKVKTEKTKKKIKTKINIKFRSSAGSNHVRVALVAVPSSSKHLNNGEGLCLERKNEKAARLTHFAGTYIYSDNMYRVDFAAK